MMAPAQSWHLLLLLLLPLVIAQVATEAHDTLSCFYNSRANISCVWSPTGGLPGVSCRVCAKPQNRTWSKKCDLFPAEPASWVCDLILDKNPNAQKLTSADRVIMSVQCQEKGNWKTVMSQEFKPFNSLRLFAPCSLQVTLRETQFCSNVTWRVPYSSHYVESHLEFEVQKRTLSQAWGDTPLLALKQNQKWICLESLAPDTPYELRVRVRVQPERGQRPAWSPWSEPLDFRTPQAAAMTKKPPPFLWSYCLSWVLSGAAGFIFILSVYFLATSRHMGSWLKKFVKCHIPDPSEFFIQLSSEHGGDFQKWLSSPFPSSAFSPSGLAPEISPLEVLDRDTKTAQLLRLQQAQGPSSPTPSSLSLASGFTNQGYFFFHLPDALEVESCQVYFTYDPCEDESEEGLPEGPPLPALPVHPGESEAYCTFPPADDLLLFTPVLLGGPAPLSAVLGNIQDRLSPSLQNGVPRDDTPQPPRPPSPGAPCQAQLYDDMVEAGEEPPDPSPWASPPESGQVKAAASCLTSNPDAYLSLQELQDQEPAHSV